MTAPVPTPPGPGGAPPERRHRADIQGMRALAVIIVIAAHAGLAPLQGGFVGVDVFFVISGYLISRLLFLEASRGETINLGRFYARRARRILPAATLVTLVTLAASVLILGAIEALAVVYDAAWAAAFAANVHFGHRGVDYFNADAGPSPLQHYWSLSVEEQFYVVWPLVLLACLAWQRRRHGFGRLPRVPVLAALGALTLISFAYAEWLTRTQPIAAYFSTPARVWELGAGAMLALVGTPVMARAGTHLRSLLAATGLGLVAVSCLEFGEETAFPGSAALLPVVGTILMLAAGTGDGPRSRVTRLLGVAPLRFLGDWSYSLYLWHWPVLILAARMLDRPLRAGETALALLVIVGLSAATYWWVETPFRSGRERPQRQVSTARALALYPATLALVATGCVGAGVYLTWEAGEHGDNPAVALSDYDHRLPGAAGATALRDEAAELVAASLQAARDRRPIPSDLSPDLLDLRGDVAGLGACDYFQNFATLCPGGDPEADKTLVLMGDSHARAWIPAFDEIAQRAGYQTYYLVRVQCAATRVATAKLGGFTADEECMAFRDWSLEQVARLQPDLVVVTSSAPQRAVFLDGVRVTDDDTIATETARGYADLFAKLAAKDRRVVLIRDVPRSSSDFASCLGRRGRDLGDCVTTPEPRAERMAAVSVKAAKNAGVEVVDPTKWFCQDGECPAVIGATIPMRDVQHITATYSRQLAEPLGRALSLWPTSIP